MHLTALLTTPKSSSPLLNTYSKFKPVPEEGKHPHSIITLFKIYYLAIPDLIELLQGSSVGLERAIKNLRVNWGRKVLANRSSSESIQSGQLTESDYEQASDISKRQLEKKIHEIAKKVGRVWQVERSVLEKYKIQLPPSNKLNLCPDISPENTLLQPHLLKENLTLNKTKVNINDKHDESSSPARKRLKLTETQSPSLVVT